MATTPKTRRLAIIGVVALALGVGLLVTGVWLISIGSGSALQGAFAILGAVVLLVFGVVDLRLSRRAEHVVDDAAEAAATEAE